MPHLCRRGMHFDDPATVQGHRSSSVVGIAVSSEHVGTCRGDGIGPSKLGVKLGRLRGRGTLRESSENIFWGIYLPITSYKDS